MLTPLPLRPVRLRRRRTRLRPLRPTREEFFEQPGNRPSHFFVGAILQFPGALSKLVSASYRLI